MVSRLSSSKDCRDWTMTEDPWKLTYIEDRQLGHHGDLVSVPVASIEGPHLGVLRQEVRLPQALEVNGVDCYQTRVGSVQHLWLQPAWD